MRTTTLLSALLSCFAASASLASAADLLVPQQFPTIQSAIGAAQDQDRILVAPGTYNERLDFLGKALRLEGTNPKDPAVVAATVLDGGNDVTAPGWPQIPFTALRAVGAQNGITAVRGLTIQNFGDEEGYPTGIEAIDNTLFVLENCVFRNNRGNGGGAGGAFIKGLAQVLDCRFEGNWADGGSGGGLALGGGQITIARCDFIDNSAEGGSGAGIAVLGTTQATVADCRFEGNVAFGGFGGGISVESSSAATVRNCEFRANRSSNGFGGGLAVQATATATASDCVFFANVASSGSGSAVAATGTGSLTLARSTVAGHTAGTAAITVRDSANVTAIDSIVWGNNTALQTVALGTASFVSSNVQDNVGGPGNLSADPLFRSLATGDLRLAAGSPSIDAANAAYQVAGVDAAGAPRLVDGDLDFDLRLDQGALEFLPLELTVTGNFTGGGSLSIGLTAAPGSFPASILLVGAAPTSLLLAPLGVLLVDPTSALLLSWPGAPSTVTGPVPFGLAPGSTVYLQAVGLAATGLAATNSAVLVYN